MEHTESQLALLARMLSCTEDREIDCDAFLDAVAAYIDAGGEQSAEAASLPEQLQRVRQHMDVCPPCKEEFDALLRARGVL